MRYRRTLHGPEVAPPRPDPFSPPFRESEAWAAADWDDDPAGPAKTEFERSWRQVDAGLRRNAQAGDAC